VCYISTMFNRTVYYMSSSVVLVIGLVLDDTALICFAGFHLINCQLQSIGDKFEDTK
jgi:hypothetical protein